MMLIFDNLTEEGGQYEKISLYYDKSEKIYKIVKYFKKENTYIIEK